MTNEVEVRITRAGAIVVDVDGRTAELTAQQARELASKLTLASLDPRASDSTSSAA